MKVDTISESIKKKQEIITSVLSPHIKATEFLAEYFQVRKEGNYNR